MNRKIDFKLVNQKPSARLAQLLYYDENRDYYIDFIRGLAVLSVVFIHTAFWSGYSYVPAFVRDIALLFDVPVFFFCSGAALGTTGRRAPIVSCVFKLSISFAILACISDFMHGNFLFINTISTLFLDGHADGLPLLAGSYWFVSVFICSLIVTGVINEYFNRYTLLVIILFLAYYFLIYFGKLSPEFLGGKRYIFFYSAVMLLGHFLFHSDKIGKTHFRWIVGLTCIMLSGGVLYLCRGELRNLPLQEFKFPVSLPYIGASFLSIGLVVLLYRKNANLPRSICKIGQESIWFYVGQCVGGSALYKIVPYIDIAWYWKLPISYICNLIITIAAAILLSLVFSMIKKANVFSSIEHIIR